MPHNSNAITDLGGSAANNGVAGLAWRFDLPDVLAFGFNYISGGIGNDRYFFDDSASAMSATCPNRRALRFGVWP